MSIDEFSLKVKEVVNQLSSCDTRPFPVWYRDFFIATVLSIVDTGYLAPLIEKEKEHVQCPRMILEDSAAKGFKNALKHKFTLKSMGRNDTLPVDIALLSYIRAAGAIVIIEIPQAEFLNTTSSKSLCSKPLLAGCAFGQPRGSSGNSHRQFCTSNFPLRLGVVISTVRL
ncbi:uncharacterized protein K444DRAFT_628374 [Hyaloscypha bicolor E]|uniref:Uncharacterized protein n=1 Tax=Hyaloscypha bicolor E TaxID=1095630 RepID=A0A2J6TED8_9HELO|nr:uncharacterized protein K444DRAFT_628374 [Hyaloscypha bicolor E]PMD61318.1 hypothetical protein K444DRAFT_628374 [Hyaloscypha bicolor E]